LQCIKQHCKTVFLSANFVVCLPARRVISVLCNIRIFFIRPLLHLLSLRLKQPRLEAAAARVIGICAQWMQEGIGEELHLLT
jgi:hypothetical protein